jgi:flagellar biosynthesis/type III secretory pathway chaperone
MIRPPPDAPDPIGSLRQLLDEEIALLDVRRSQLASLCAAIIDRDDDAVERLLDQIERAHELQAATDRRLEALRQVLCERLGCARDEVRLSALIAALPEADRQPLAERRQRIIELAERLQLEHMRTVILLGECARINRLLLESLFPAAEGVATYNARGADHWRPEAGLVDTEQ